MRHRASPEFIRPRNGVPMTFTTRIRRHRASSPQGSSINGSCLFSVEDVYDIENELGTGSFSVVRRGRHRTTGEDVAIKIISSSKFGFNKRAQESILVEVEAMRRLGWSVQNPCLIKMLGVFSDPMKVSIILEYVNGGELFDRIVARGRYTEKDASHLLRKLVGALGQCHQQGILHRDIKPENILYVSRDEDSEIKIIDFGLAMLENGPSVMCRSENLVGTPGYVAPEVLSSRLYGPPCDVWACGVVTYILLAGYPPFYAGEGDTLFEAIKKGKYFFHRDAWDQISSEAKDLVFKMLTVDVTKRATVASILEHPWLAPSSDLAEQHLSGTIKRLKEFNAKRKWRAVATVVMMGARMGLKKRNRSADEKGDAKGDGCEKQEFSEWELDILKKAFYSSAEGGVLSKTQLAAVLSDVGFGPVPSDRMFDLFDKDGNGQVDYQEFLTGMASFRHSGDKSLQFCFDVYDRDGHGAINLDQLKSVLSCVMQPQDISGVDSNYGHVDQEEKLEKMFAILDADGNGTIDFNEFKAGVKREPLLVRAFLAPVQQGSLATAPAAHRQATASSSGKAAVTERPEESPTADWKSFTTPNETASRRPQQGEQGEQGGGSPRAAR